VRAISIKQAGQSAQAEVLRAAYDRIENLQQAIAHLALASFRGFSICQLQDNNGNPAAPGAATRIECLPHWCFVRDGQDGAFKWNPDAQQTSFDTLAGEPLDPVRDRLLIRAVPRAINRVALVKFVRSNFTQKAWADYIEKVANDGVFITGPQNVPAGQETKYETTAENASAAGGGYLPFGCKVDFANTQRGLSPFEDHMRFLREQLVMAGTGGLLTMLAEPTGIGQGASSAHQEAFKQIARSEAKAISEIFQKNFDKPLLAERFPGEPVSAWFELAYREETDASQMIEQGVALSQVFDLDASEWSEKTGLRLAPKSGAPQIGIGAPPSGARSAALMNSAKRVRNRQSQDAALALVKQSLERLAEAEAKDLNAIYGRIEELISADETAFAGKLAKLREDLPDLLPAEPELAAELEKTLSAAVFTGLTEGPQTKASKIPG
jgi:hypothetical protein